MITCIYFTCIYIYIYIYIWIILYTYIHNILHTYICIHTYLYKNKHTHTYIYVSYTSTCINIYTHIHVIFIIHMHIHKYIHITSMTSINSNICPTRDALPARLDASGAAFTCQNPPKISQNWRSLLQKSPIKETILQKRPIILRSLLIVATSYSMYYIQGLCKGLLRFSLPAMWTSSLVLWSQKFWKSSVYYIKGLCKRLLRICTSEVNEPVSPPITDVSCDVKYEGLWC